MNRLRFPALASLLVLTPIVLLAATPPARADIPPTCDQEALLITCAAADVGKPCQGAGQCYAVSCSATTPGTTSTEYKCDACPTVMPSNGAACSTTNVGTACGNGGMCTVLSSWCAGAGSKYVCATPAPAQPTGPPAGETGAAGAGGGGGAAGGGGASPSGTGGGSGSSGGGGGCAVIAGAPTTAGIAAGLMAIGLGLLALSRRRRAR